MKKLLFLALLSFISLSFVTQSVRADTQPGKQWGFNWVDKETLFFESINPNVPEGNLSYTGSGASYAVFQGTFDFSRIEGCSPNTSFVVHIENDVYDSATPPDPTTIHNILVKNACDFTRRNFQDEDDNFYTIFFTSNSDSSAFSSAEGAETEEDDSCESKGGAMGWIMCPVILAMDKGFSFLDGIISGLLEVDEERYNNEGMQAAAANIRTIAFSILIPIMLVMIIGTALGFDFISAYSVKKALPRLVIAVIFIAISFPLLSFFIEFVDAIGAGVMGLLTAPFKDAGTVGTLSIGDMYGSEGVGGFLTSLPSNLALGTGIIVFLAFFYPVILMGAAIAFGLLMLRQIFIVALLMVAPLAILAWIFPGNDKLWNGWWSGFSKLLFVYPLIIAVIAIGRIFAAIILEPSARPAGAEGAIITPIMGLVAYVAPYAFIPFAFKTAGGVFGNLAGMADNKTKGFFDKQRQKRSQKYERSFGRGILQARNKAAGKLGDSASKDFSHRGRAGRIAGRTRNMALGAASRGVGGYNLQSQISEKNATVGKEINDQIATGRDEEIRGLAALHSYDAAKNNLAKAEADGLTRVNNDGQRQYKSLGGAWINEADVVAGKKRWGSDHFAQQSALAYELRKATTSEQVSGVEKQYGALSESWGMSDGESQGAWVGATFANQGQHLALKHTNTKGELKQSDLGDGSKGARGQGLVQEVFDNKGSYPIAQMNAHTVKKLKESHDNAQSVLKSPGSTELQKQAAKETIRQSQEIAQTFMMRSGSTVEGEDGEIIPTASRGASEPSAPGSGAVNAAVRDFASHVLPRQPDTEWRNPEGYL